MFWFFVCSARVRSLGHIINVINRLTGDEVRCRHAWSLLRRSLFKCSHWFVYTSALASVTTTTVSTHEFDCVFSIHLLALL